MLLDVLIFGLVCALGLVLELLVARLISLAYMRTRYELGFSGVNGLGSTNTRRTSTPSSSLTFDFVACGSHFVLDLGITFSLFVAGRVFFSSYDSALLFFGAQRPPDRINFLVLTGAGCLPHALQVPWICVGGPILSLPLTCGV